MQQLNMIMIKQRLKATGKSAVTVEIPQKMTACIQKSYQTYQQFLEHKKIEKCHLKRQKSEEAVSHDIVPEKPGSSKSLAKSIVTEVMEGANSYSELFKVKSDTTLEIFERVQ